jgi:hypothetical protein
MQTTNMFVQFVKNDTNIFPTSKSIILQLIQNLGSIALYAKSSLRRLQIAEPISEICISLHQKNVQGWQ